MAGLAINAPSRPPLHHTKLKPPQLIFPYSLPSADSSFFCLRLSLCSSTKFDPLLSLSASRRPAIDARYGSGGINRSDDEQALNMSSIRSDNVRLIDEQQNMVGVVSKSVAIQMAEDAELDLVVVSPDADPPVVRIMDFDKYRYELQKKKREQQKKSAASRMDLKELKMGYNIDVHDYSVRLKAAQKFLKDGDKVKIIVNLKGRENAFRSKAIELIKQFKDDIGELATQESKNFNDRNVFMVLVPNKAVSQKGQEVLKKKDKSPATEVSAGT